MLYAFKSYMGFLVIMVTSVTIYSCFLETVKNIYVGKLEAFCIPFVYWTLLEVLFPTWL